MSNGATVRIQPASLLLQGYGSEWWRIRARAAWGDLTDATIAARFRADGAEESIDLPLDSTSEDLADGVVVFGQDQLAAGAFSIAIALPDGPPRTYIVGRIEATEAVT